MIEGGDAGWGSAVPLLALALSVVAFAVFLAIERRAAAPMLPLELFRSRVFSASAFVGAAINFGFYGQLFAISLYFQQVRGYDALATGLAMLPEGLFVSVASAFAGRLTARVGPRVPMLIGLTTGGLGLVGLVVAGPDTPYPVLIAAAGRRRVRHRRDDARGDGGDHRGGTRPPRRDRRGRAQRVAPGRRHARRGRAREP